MIEAMAGMLPQRQKIKVFCFFSSEKKTFLSFFRCALSMRPLPRIAQARCGLRRLAANNLAEDGVKFGRLGVIGGNPFLVRIDVAG